MMPKMVLSDNDQLAKDGHEKRALLLTKIQLHNTNCAICGQPFLEAQIYTAIVGPKYGDTSHYKCYKEHLRRWQ